MPELLKAIDVSCYSEGQQQRFIDGWKSAGGYTGDIEDSPAPWACPWTYLKLLYVKPLPDYRPEAVAAAYWADCEDAVKAYLKDGEDSDEAL